MARFLIHDFLLWLAFTVPVVRSARSFIRCYFIISIGSWRSMRDVSRGSTDSSGRLSRMLSTSILTVAARAAGSPASGVLTAPRSGSSCSLAAPGDSAHRVMPSGSRNGGNGCGRGFSRVGYRYGKEAGNVE